MKIYKTDRGSKLARPLFSNKVAAGFPSPAEDFVEGKLDLNEKLIEHPSSTFFVRVTGNSMLGANIMDGDILIVDRSIEASNNKIVIAVIDGELTVKRFRQIGNKISLVPENKDYPTLDIVTEDFSIWGVVTYVIHKA